jgi:hypothetical protein
VLTIANALAAAVSQGAGKRKKDKESLGTSHAAEDTAEALTDAIADTVSTAAAVNEPPEQLEDTSAGAPLQAEDTAATDSTAIAGWSLSGVKAKLGL